MRDELLGVITTTYSVDCARCQCTATRQDIEGRGHFMYDLMAEGWCRVGGIWHCEPCAMLMRGELPTPEPEA